MKQTADGKTILTREEAKAFAAFLMNERQRHMKDMDHIERSLIAIAANSDIKLGWPKIDSNNMKYSIDGCPLNVPWVDSESLSVENK